MGTLLSMGSLCLWYKVQCLVRAGKGQPQATVLFQRNWDFLEGDKTCPHTLKAGTHEWPFTVELDGSAPCSIYTDSGLASIVYNFRAIAVRPTFSNNYVANKTVNVVRAFSTEALEYQQSLEIENIWPEKIMYRIVCQQRVLVSAMTDTSLHRPPHTRLGRLATIYQRCLSSHHW